MILFITLQSYGMNTLDESKSVITAPSIGSKCLVLLNNRSHKVKYKQKLASLIERNIKLQHHKIDDIKVRQTLISNLRKLRNEYILVKGRVRFLSNEIVKTGCPAIRI
ncbi:MAG: hypothetical protein KAG61_05500 [Bacteriovoracaceae bacterium]|nr:hypothetical protein [Bacteriovoracaceae bacterium]